MNRIAAPTRVRKKRVLLSLAAVPVLAVALSACGSSSSSSNAGTPTPTPSNPSAPTSSATTASNPGAACTSQAILAALPGGAAMEHFNCANVGGQQWAAAKVNPGNTVFFLQWTGSKWNAEDSGSVCGTASAGLPQSLLSYCQS